MLLGCDSSRRCTEQQCGCINLHFDLVDDGCSWRLAAGDRRQRLLPKDGLSTDDFEGMKDSSENEYIFTIVMPVAPRDTLEQDDDKEARWWIASDGDGCWRLAYVTGSRRLRYADKLLTLSFIRHINHVRSFRLSNICTPK